ISPYCGCCVNSSLILSLWRVCGEMVARMMKFSSNPVRYPREFVIFLQIDFGILVGLDEIDHLILPEKRVWTERYGDQR
ncbi:hypothetical protein HAX54_012567, partial [Datura stramonium]|nr:hypothetical protein [Datura stramonium]